METKKKAPRVPRIWLWLGSFTIPLALVILFEVLKNRQRLMSAWVFGVMAPTEQFFGRRWSVLPFSAAEALSALFLTGSIAWLVWAAAQARGQPRWWPRSPRIWVSLRWAW